jgi:hypothetical protein
VRAVYQVSRFGGSNGRGTGANSWQEGKARKAPTSHDLSMTLHRLQITPNITGEGWQMPALCTCIQMLAYIGLANSIGIHINHSAGLH